MKLNTMLRVLTALLVITICLSSTGTAADVQKTYYVSAAGSDKNPGTAAEPFKTIQRARDEVRKINQKMTGNVEVILRDGTYPLSETPSGQNSQPKRNCHPNQGLRDYQNW